MKLFKKICTGILLLTMAMGSVGCKDKEEINLDEYNFGSSGETEFMSGDVVSRFGKHDHNYSKKTTRPFIEDGVSQYVIVVPEQLPEVGEYALAELQYFLELATGVKVQAVKDYTQVSSGAKFISLGETEQFKQTGWKLDYDTYKMSGFNIKSKDENVYIFSSHANGNYNGVLCGVYEFLKHVIHLEIYTEEDFSYTETDTLYMPTFYVEEIPDFDQREIGEVRIKNYMNRLRLLKNAWTSPYGMGGHSQLIILQQSEEWRNHPDWISAKGDVLCWSAYKSGMDVEYVNNMVNLLLKHPNQDLFNLSTPDFTSPCTCDRCEETKEEYGTNNSGLMIIFLNKVIEATIDRMAEIEPDRTISFVTYAYEGSKVPPVNYDEETGKYVAHCKEVIPHERLAIQFAPIEASICYPLDSDVNRDSYNNWMGWSAIAKDMWNFMYPYCSYSQAFTAPAFAVFPANARMFAQGPLTKCYEERISTSAAFWDLFNYVESKMMWNVNYDFELLAKRYIENVYGPAAPAIQEYYDFLVVWSASGAYADISTYATPKAKIFTQKVYAKSALNVWDSCLERAYTLLDESDCKGERYAMIKDKIDFLYFTNNVNRVETYHAQMGEDERVEKVAEIKSVYNALKYRKYMSLGGQISWESWFKDRG